MEQNNPKFRFHLNLFDGIVILAALVIAAFLLWNRFKPASSSSASPAASTIQYTICLQKVLSGTGDLIHSGDALEDTVKNYALGDVVSARVEGATRSILSEDTLEYVTAEIPGYDDVYIVVESTASISDEKILLSDGYELRVGESIYLRGPGYLGSGKVYAIERGQ
jgi:hypothetical protein